MKKSTKSFLSILLTLIIIFSPTLLLSFKAEAYVGLGDANYDGRIDDWDVGAILGLSTGINCERPDLADVNSDSKVNSVDAKILSLAYGGYFPIDTEDYANINYDSAFIPSDSNVRFSFKEVYNDGNTMIVDINLDSGGFYALDIKFNTVGLKFNYIKTYSITESAVFYNPSATEGYNHISAISSNGAFVSVGEPILPTEGTGLFATIEFEITATNYSYEAEVFECGKLVQLAESSGHSDVNFNYGELIASGNYGEKSGSTYGTNIKWDFYENGTLVISGQGKMYNEKINTAGQSDTNGTRWGGNKNKIKHVIVKYGVTNIGDFAFYNCSNLQSYYLPSSITKIGADAFHFCSNLTSIQIPHNVTNIMRYAFGQISKNITSINIPDKVETIDSYAFYNCTNLKNLSFGANIKSIGTNAFLGCGNLERTYYNGKKEQWNQISISDGNDCLTKSNINFNDGTTTNFKSNKYSFLNYEDIVPQEIYEDIYGEYKGGLIWAKHENEKHGLCYGFASTTGAILMKHPEISSFVNVFGECETVSDITKFGTYCFDLNGINTTTFIKYGYATQFSTQATETYRDCSKIYNAVYDYVYGNGAPVLIDLQEIKYNQITQTWEQSFGHSVLATGIAGKNKIVVDDSNYTEPQIITFFIDGNGQFTNNWSYPAYEETWGTDYSGLNKEELAEIGRIGYIGYGPNAATLLPYMVEKANAKLDYNGTLPSNATSRVNFEVIDSDCNLVSVSDPDLLISSSNTDLIKIREPSTGSNHIDLNPTHLYWSKSDSIITVETLKKNNSSVSVAGNNSQVTATLSADSKATINTTDTDSNVEITSNSSKEYSVDISSLINNEDINMTISGVANGEEIVVSRNENSVEVSGLNDVNATLKVDENTEKRTTFNVDNGDKLTLDFDNENSDIKTDKEFLITVSENNSFRVGDIANLDVTVIGNPSKIRFIDSKNNTTTYTAESSSVKSITDNGDGTFTWNLDINVQDEKETYSVYAKFEEIGWNSESGIVTLTAQPFDYSYHSTEFDVISDGVIYNGINTLTVKTGMDVSKVQLYKNGNTWTYTDDTATVAEENGVKVWTIKMNFSQLGDQTYYVRTRSRKTAFEVVDTLNLTVYSK
ncbi:leucine-rich repeat protein [Methanobrevibacter sp.]|uniref:leucine-rich repeat protein n=1 Tax=Methanobrevibacter sp. TaxID=66852 RepID=UPI00388F41A2